MGKWKLILLIHFGVGRNEDIRYGIGMWCTFQQTFSMFWSCLVPELGLCAKSSMLSDKRKLGSWL